MITDLFFTLIMVLFIALGFKNPVVALSAVMWVDTVKPQNTSFSFLSGKPLSLIITAFFFISLIISFKKLRLPRNKNFMTLMIVFMIWITICTFNADFPSVAWMKYDVSIKTLFLIFFIPIVISKKEDFDLILAILVASSGLFIIMGGVKTAMGGGGYGVTLIGLQGSGFMYSEGSMLATLAICIIPLVIYLYRYSYLKNSTVFRYFAFFLIFCSLFTVIGTQARTGVVVLCLYIFLLIYSSKSKVKAILSVIIVALMITPYVTDGFKNRANSIEASTTTEKSAVGRIVVWRWAFDYVKDKPVTGGGFYAYLANAGQLHNYAGEGEVVISQKGAKAYHNIYIEVLAETGYVGLTIFLLIILQTISLNLKTIKAAKLNPNDELDKDRYIYSAKSLNVFILLYCAGGMFINVAFYPWIYYIFALAATNHKIYNIQHDKT